MAALTFVFVLYCHLIICMCDALKFERVSSTAGLHDFRALGCVIEKYNRDSARTAKYDPSSYSCEAMPESWFSNRVQDGHSIYYAQVPADIQDCLSLYQYGSKTNGVYEIQPSEWGDSVLAYCDMENGGWTVILHRGDFSGNFDRRWTDYVYGFGSRSGAYWLGLGNIYDLTNQNSILKVSLISDSRVGYATYTPFRIEDTSSDYTLSVGDYETSLPCMGDALGPHDGMRFSTKDRDNDIHDVDNCAKLHKGGWWYTECFMCLLTGQNKHPFGMTWRSHNGPGYWSCFNNNDMKEATMKVKRY